MQIRAYMPDDLADILSLDQQCFSHSWSQGSWESSLASEQYRCFVLEEQGELAGFLLISFVLDEGELLKIGVAPAQRGKALGKALLEYGLRWWKQQGICQIFLEVRESNQPAIYLYENAGFEHIGVRKNYYQNPKENAVLYQKIFADAEC